MQLSERSLPTFLSELGAKVPVPGGGGGAALAAALGAALGKMAAEYSKGKKAFAGQEKEQEALLQTCSRLSREFLALVDVDAAQFAPLARAYALPSDTEQEQEEKARVMEERLLDAAMVPLRIMEEAVRTMELLEVLAKKGSVMAVSDVGVAVQFARTALLGGVMNVYINTKSMNNRSRAQELNAQADQLVAEGTALADRIYGEVLKGLAN